MTGLTILMFNRYNRYKLGKSQACIFKINALVAFEKLKYWRVVQGVSKTRSES
jgi:hypothetical protein